MQMHTLLALALAGPALAFGPPLVTPPPQALGGHLLARDARDDASCATALAAATANVPPVPTALASWAANNVQNVELYVGSQISELKRIDNAEGICSEAMAAASATPPASLQSAYDRYTSSLSSWLSRAKPTFSSIAAQCTADGVADLMGVAAEFFTATTIPECTAAVNRYNSNSLVASGASSSSLKGFPMLAGVGDYGVALDVTSL
ncbi:hypothetical protein VTJ49DRAFT_6556 [Mycothermus thermophilus]|uniref:DUF7735 domain-containing protein n=1 Tax=Humicola insolens TaxID=85995 RepID=A0ABR3VKB2_HUMIN